jgi:chromosome segregation ATPase
MNIFFGLLIFSCFVPAVILPTLIYGICLLINHHSSDSQDKERPKNAEKQKKGFNDGWFILLERDNEIKAIDLENNSQAELLVSEFVAFGYIEVAHLQAKNEDDAIKIYHDLLSENKKPLDKANETIRAANTRISELKMQIQALKELVDEYEENIAELNGDIESLNITITQLKNKVNNSNNKNAFNHYQWLGFESIPTKAELKSKYKKLNLIYHPDKGGCGEVMSKINEAYNSLLKVAS